MTVRNPSATLVLAAALLLCSCRVEQREQPAVINPDSATRLEIHNTAARYRAALLRADAPAAATFFTDSARLITSDAPDVTGIDEIRRTLRAGFDGVRITEAVMTPDFVDVVRGGTAYEMGTYREVWTAPGADSVHTAKGRYAIRWRRGADAAWQIDRFLTSRLPADSAAGDAAADTTGS